MKIEVTADDIFMGIAGRCRDCPIARAVCRAAGVPASWLAVHSRYAMIDGKRYTLPVEAQAFIRTYDLGREVEPFTFDLESDAGLAKEVAA